jgi:hypothetical protein
MHATAPPATAARVQVPPATRRLVKASTMQDPLHADMCLVFGQGQCRRGPSRTSRTPRGLPEYQQPASGEPHRRAHEPSLPRRLQHYPGDRSSARDTPRRHRKSCTPNRETSTHFSRYSKLGKQWGHRGLREQIKGDQCLVKGKQSTGCAGSSIDPVAAQQPTRATATRSTLCSKPAALAYPGRAMAENPCASLAKEKGHKKNQINIINKSFTLFLTTNNFIN